MVHVTCDEQENSHSLDQCYTNRVYTRHSTTLRHAAGGDSCGKKDSDVSRLLLRPGKVCSTESLGWNQTKGWSARTFVTIVAASQTPRKLRISHLLYQGQYSAYT